MRISVKIGGMASLFLCYCGFFLESFIYLVKGPKNRQFTCICLCESLQVSVLHSSLKAANSFGELGPKREVVLNGSKGPESDFGGSKIRTDS